MVFESLFKDIEPDESFGGLISNLYWQKLDEFKERTLFVDFVSGRQWTGAQIKTTSAHLARNLIEKCHLKPNSDCVSFYYNCDHLQLLSLGLLFAGGGICAGAPEDPEHEHAHMLDVMQPALVITERALVSEMLRLREGGKLGAFQVIIMDDEQLKASDFEELEKAAKLVNTRIFGYHTHLYEPTTNQLAVDSAAIKLPVQVHPDRPAYVLLTSGSTGRPKPVNRSQKNSLYVCYSLAGPAGVRLWHMDGGEQSVLAGHLQLDHGTGTFCLKQTLAKGLKLIIMHGYDYATFLEATRTYGITDACLGSALLHNFLTTALTADKSINLLKSDQDLSTLRNFLAVGSPIASQTLVNQFMERFSNCSIRQAYGMTECGFVAVMEPHRRVNIETSTSEKSPRNPLEPVGLLLPNLRAKLVDRISGKEIKQLEVEGELYVSGPTVSPGYLGARFEGQARDAFLPNGFYKTNDICQMLPGGQIKIRGRFSEILCLQDGWKVLPSEIEQVLMSHPQIKEAAVVGIPHPHLPTCHAPRAYVVPKEGVQADFDLDFELRLQKETNSLDRKSLNGSHDMESKTSDGEGGKQGGEQRLTKERVFEFTANLLSEPKHLIGGIRLLHKLPRISIGKFDKKLLRKLDGYT